MINYVHSLFHRPERGWDPIPAAYASSYSKAEWQNIDYKFLDDLEDRIGGFSGKTILDLGGGPGQYSIAFAKRGARVTWHDVSRSYLEIVRQSAVQERVDIELSLGYLEDARRLIMAPFDFVFNRICWCYCMNDRKFARLFYLLVKPGGAGYIDSMKPIPEEVNGHRSIVFMLNKYLGLKIGHPNPPHGRIARLLHAYPMQRMILDYASATNDRIFFIKSAG